MMTIAACLWLGLFPLLQGGTYARITIDKWYIMCVLGVATLALFVVDALTRRAPAPEGGAPAGAAPRPRFSRWPLVFGAVLLLFSLLSCLLGPYGWQNWWLGASMRQEGLLTQFCYLGLFFLFAFSRVHLKPVLLSAAAAVTVFLVIVLLQRGNGNPLGLYPHGRSFLLNPEFQGTIGNVDMGTGWLCMLAGFFAFGGAGILRSVIRTERSGRRAPGRTFSLVTVVACAIGLAVSVFLVVTMDVQFGVISLGVLLAVSLFRFVPRRWRLPLLILLLVLAFAVVWFWPGTGGGLWELHEILRGRARLSFGSNRIAVWYYSMPLAKQNLLLGGGSDTFVLRFNDHLQRNALRIPTEQDGLILPDYFDTPHNDYLAQWLNHGLPAMLAFILLLGCAVWKKRDGILPLLTPCSAAVLCYAVQAFFSFSVCIVAPVFWVLLGACRQENPE